MYNIHGPIGIVYALCQCVLYTCTKFILSIGKNVNKLSEKSISVQPISVTAATASPCIFSLLAAVLPAVGPIVNIYVTVCVNLLNLFIS